MSKQPAMQHLKFANKRLINVAEASNISTSGFATKFNLTSDKCEWPTVINGTRVEKCNFQFTDTEYSIDYKNKVYKIIKIEPATILFHGTREKNVVLSEASAFKSVKNVIWFATSINHALMTNPFNIYEFIVQEPMYLIYIHNIYKDLHIPSGNNFVIDMGIISHKLNEKYGIDIDGYAGCNECEYGIYIDSINKLAFPPHKMEVSVKLIN